MGYFNLYFIKKLLSKLFTKKTLIYIIIFLVIIILKSNVFAATPTGDTDIFQELKTKQIEMQNNLVFFLYPPFYGNTEMWEDIFLPIFQKCNSEGYHLYVEDFALPTSNTNLTQIRIRLVKDRAGTTTSNFEGFNNTVYQYQAETFNNTIRYAIDYRHDTNDAVMTTSVSNYNIPFGLYRVQSPAMIELENLIARREAGLTEDYTLILSQMSQYLDDLNDINTQLLSTINSFTATLNQISSNTSTNYSQQIGQISNKINDILDDNDTIISQNSQMIQQQEEINNNLEDVNDSVQELKDTITDDTVESSASDLPSTNVNNPTENGIDNIFSSIYNAFCVGQAQDIVFPIPFTDKNITLSPYYVQDMLNNNNAGWVYTLIQAFWGYLIGRYIVTDISKKIDKIKSGNIEDVENSNIKEEML